MKKKVSLIVPVCNEQGNILKLYKAVDGIFQKLSYEYDIIFVDDGSSDHTLDLIKSIAENTHCVKYISFSRNFGHQSALKAGIDFSNADCIISMDGDMQHPPAIIPQLLDKWENGYDVVYTIRNDDKKNPYLKRKLSAAFYGFLNKISDIKIQKGAADFRLISRKVVDVLKDLDEYNLFLRGLVTWIGFQQFAIKYTPGRRMNGKTKYSYKKMIGFALNGITSFSDKPLYLAAYLGCLFALLSVLYLPYAIGSYLFHYTISGWTSIIVTLSFFGGLQLMILGIIGIYLGKLFMQSKKRPLYILEGIKYFMQGKNRKFVLLSFDVEEFDIPLDYHQPIGLQEQLAVGHQGLMNLMELLESEKQVTCTFFTTSCFAENFPKTVQELSISHEIASHTCSNSTFHKGELALSKNILESIIQKPVYGLRMPQMQEPDMKEVSQVPYAYDASINPCWLPGHYNNWGRPRTPFRENHVVRIPASVSANLRIPLFWLSFKIFPYSYFRYLAREVLHKYGYLSLYFHPWEFTDIHPYHIPRYYKRHSEKLLLNRLDKLIRDFQKEADFISMFDYYNQIQLCTNM